jgi:hypothetical protein
VVVTLTWAAGTKLAESVLSASTSSVVGFCVPLAAPIQPLKPYPLAAIAVAVTVVPDRYVPPDGESETLPPVDGETVTL